MFSRNGPPRSALSGAFLLTFVVGSLILGALAYQLTQAAASGSSAFDINGGAPVTVGSVVPYVFTITNQSSTPQSAETVQLTSISGYPSCATIELTNPLCSTPANQDAGVFSPAGVGTGAAGTACAGSTFTVTENVAGLWSFTPLVPATFPILGPANVGGPGATCAIVGLTTVDAMPAADANPGLAGKQTQQLSDARGTTSGTSQQFIGLGTAELTVQQLPPTIVTTSTPTGAGVSPGTSVSDQATVSGSGPTPTGNVTFFLCQPAEVTGAGCPAPNGTQVGAAKALVAGSATSDSTTNTTTPGKYCWRVEYGGNAVYTAGTHTNETTECFTVEKLTPQVATTSTPTGAGVTPGTSVTDNAVVSGSGPVPTGNVTFFLCQPAEVSGAGCESPNGTQVGAAKALVAGSATSDATSATTTVGKYCWRAEYAGDSVYNAASHTNSTTECFTVEKLPPTVTTTSNPTGPGVTPGSAVTDNATVSGSGPTPTGNVTFFLCQPADVTGAGCPSPNGSQVGGAKVLVGGSATSDATSNTTTVGKYCWRAEYAGDSVYNASSHTNSTTECFTVAKLPPTVATTSNPTGTGVTPGAAVVDNATVSGSGPTPTGNVTFFLCQPADVTGAGCPAPNGSQVGSPKALAGGSATSDSTSNTTTTGKYCWRAEYAGDAVYEAGSHTNATSECFTVAKLPPTVSTASTPTGAGVAPGTSATDLATITGSGPTPTGSVTFFLCQPAEVTGTGCASPHGTQVGAAKALVGGSATSDATTNTNSVGKYCWRVEYTGDAVYNPSTHTNLTSECFVVEKRQPNVATQSTPSGPGVAPGAAVTDKATVSGSGATPTGTVTFFLCQPATVTANGGDCSAGGAQVGGPVALAGGIATSASTTNTLVTGKYCWRAAYSGDAVYDPASHTNSTSECFTVKIDPDLTVTKELKPGQPAPTAGGRLYYLVRVKNIGGTATPPPPSTVTLIDTPPAGTTIVNWTIISGSGRCSIDGLGRLVCDLGASMAPGAETVVEVVIRTPKGGSLTNTAEVDPFNRIQESNETNNKTTLVTVVP